MRLIKRFIVTIEGPGWTDFDELELPRQPDEGEALETKYGLCLVTRAELTPDAGQHDGKINCRLP